jgi:hypothetical protein
MSVSSGNGPVSLSRLKIRQIVRVLSKAGGKTVTEKRVKEDIEAGAPVNGDGTVNLVEYIAWLARETASGSN